VLAVWGNKQKGIWVKCPKKGPCPASPTRLFFLYHIFKVQSKRKPNKNWDLAAFFSIIRALFDKTRVDESTEYFESAKSKK